LGGSFGPTGSFFCNAARGDLDERLAAKEAERKLRRRMLQTAAILRPRGKMAAAFRDCRPRASDDHPTGVASAALDATSFIIQDGLKDLLSIR